MATDEHIEVYRGEDNDWWWRWVAPNGKKRGDSGEGYENREDCFEAARHISEAAPPVRLAEPAEAAAE